MKPLLAMLLAGLAFPAGAAEIEMETAPEPNTDVEMPDVEVRQPNIQRQIDPAPEIREPNVRLPQVELAPPRTGLGELDELPSGAERPTVRGGIDRPGQARQPNTEIRRPGTDIREPATDIRQPDTDTRRPSTSIRAPASE